MVWPMIRVDGAVIPSDCAATISPVNTWWLVKSFFSILTVPPPGIVAAPVKRTAAAVSRVAWMRRDRPRIGCSLNGFDRPQALLFQGSSR